MTKIIGSMVMGLIDVVCWDGSLHSDSHEAGTDVDFDGDPIRFSDMGR